MEPGCSARPPLRSPAAPGCTHPQAAALHRGADVALARPQPGVKLQQRAGPGQARGVQPVRRAGEQQAGLSVWAHKPPQSSPQGAGQHDI